MNGRKRRGNRQGSMKARLGIATAVLVGGGAVGVAAVAASNHGPATTTAAQSAGFIMNFHHRISEQAALSSAISMWGTSQQRSMSTLAQMVPMRNFSQVMHHRTMFAAQRGVVVLATHRFLVVKSANGSLHLWWLTGRTMFQNVAANPTGMTAMIGNNTATVQAMVNQNMAPAAAVMAGGTAVVNQMAAPVAKPTTITIATGTQIITITITSTTATVTQPVTTPTTLPSGTPTGAPTVVPSGMPSTVPSGMPSTRPSGAPTVTATPGVTVTPITTTTPVATPTVTATATQPTFTAMQGVARGDLVFVTGVRTHGMLVARIVLFAAPATTVTPTATATNPVVTPTATATVTAVPSVRPSVTGTAPTFSGGHS
jgi:hypothetical protein